MVEEGGIGAMEEMERFLPVTRVWFAEKIGPATDVQRRAWPAIQAGESTLIAAPTGSGKTLAAVLPCVDRMAREKLTTEPGKRGGVRVLYVTPLKALNNDIHHHLDHFIRELKETAERIGQPWPELAIGVRTGDTSQSTRASMLRKPPELLVTTPESLYILLTSERARGILQTVEQVIVDEIHDLAADKRGVHLSVSLERLEELCGRPIQRIGVSATQKPIERMAHYLGGWEPGEPEEASLLQQDDGGDQAGEGSSIDEATPASEAILGRGYRPRPVTIVESPMERKLALTVTMAERPGMGRGEERIWQRLLDKLFLLMEGATTCILFTNSRRLCERLTLRLNEHAGDEIARSHHGSVSREKRLEVERMLKAGELRCLVATSSLELGIDVGAVDLVIQVDSPKTASAAIQRFGRAGHAVGGVSRGVMLARTKGELPEAAVLARAAMNRDIEPIRVPRHGLDVLSQQLVAMAALDDWELERLKGVLARSYCYHGLPEARLTAALDVLGGLFPFSRPLLEWDREKGKVSRRPGTSMAAIVGAGTIPPSSGYPVHHAETRVHVGELDEEYIYESRVGDVFQLGASSWTIREIRADRIYVTETANRFSEIPFWKALPISRSVELGQTIGRFLAELAGRDLSQPERIQEWLKQECRLDEPAALALIELVKAQKVASDVPTDRRIVLEHYPDDVGRHHLVIHSLFGRRFNVTWQLALRAELEKVVPERFYSGVRDNGIEFVFPQWNTAWLAAISRVDAGRLEELVLDALPGSPLFGTHFRRIAEVSLLLTRGFTRMPSWKQRMRAEELLREAVLYSERFPYVREAIEEAMNESLSVPEVKKLLRDIADGSVEVVHRDNGFPSPFAREFLQEYIMDSFYESDAVSRDLQQQVLGVSRELAAELFGEEGAANAISPVVLREERERLEAPPREKLSREEAYRLLKERGDQSEREWNALAREEATVLRESLQRDGKVARVFVAGEERLICADEQSIYATFPESEESVSFIVRRYLDHRLSFTPAEIAERYGLDVERCRGLIREWSGQALVKPAPFAEPGEPELWTSAKVAERIVRFSLLEFRRQADPVEPAKYAAYLCSLHGLAGEASQSGISGPDRLREVIASLEGLFLPASHYETHLFPARMPGYRKEDLDLLCASGDVRWMGLRREGEKEGRVAFFLAESKELTVPFAITEEETRQPELLAYLQEKGACFLTQISRDLGAPPSVLLDKLLELVWEGRVANDQFAPLRKALTKSRAQAAPGRANAFQSGLGRWYAIGGEKLPPNAAHEVQREWREREDRAAAAWVRRLLAAFGMVTRNLVAEYSPYSWDRLYGILKQLEDWGMLTRGFFVSGIPVMQFAARETVETLRGLPALREGGGFALVSAADPANPYGVLLPWPERAGASFSRKPSHSLFLRGQVWELWLENGGKRITDMALPDDSERRRSSLSFALRAVMTFGKLRKVQVERWNGLPVGESLEAEELQALGGERDREALVFWPSSLPAPPLR
ncbi:DEAD/DEAH box helicase [Gorillibacterium sp. CAU 1737]|uniref:DEAD/DEAH box helicase n=1 Tax=Gorillibacterium sp. CAU 1737 TaxID=3140362 RepID=UPI0032617E40